MRLKRGSTKKHKSKSKKKARTGVSSGRPNTTLSGFGSPDFVFNSDTPNTSITGFGVDICYHQKNQKACNEHEGECV